MTKVKIDDIEYDTDEMSEQARNTLVSVRFVDQQIKQKGHELNIAKTARAAYATALKKELAKNSPDDAAQGED